MRGRGRFPAAALASFILAGGLVPALMFVTNWGLWEIVWFVKHWGYLIAATAITGSCVGLLAWLAYRHRRWWFLCLPSIILWCLTAFLVVGFRIDDGEGGFGLHCASIRRGETVDEFEHRMTSWGHSVPTYEAKEEENVATFEGDLDTWFHVYFDKHTRRIIRWRYSSV